MFELRLSFLAQQSADECVRIKRELMSLANKKAAYAISQANFSGCGETIHGPGRYELGWSKLRTFEAAKKLKDAFEDAGMEMGLVDLVVTFKEM